MTEYTDEQLDRLAWVIEHPEEFAIHTAWEEVNYVLDELKAHRATQAEYQAAWDAWEKLAWAFRERTGAWAERPPKKMP